jgi:hypothetical protein
MKRSFLTLWHREETEKPRRQTPAGPKGYAVHSSTR